MDFSEYRGRRVVVTGSSSGIGQATARALVDLGAEVHGAALQGSGDDLASFQTLDLSDPDSIDAAVAGIGGHVDSLFNCAGASPLIDPLDILKVNFLGTRLFTERVLALMSPGAAIVSVSSDGGYAWRKRRSLILQFLEATSFDGGFAWYQERQAEVGHAYAFAKEAIDVWTMLQSSQLIARGIRINVASPGAVQTPMLEAIEAAFPSELIDQVTHPIGRRSSPEEQVGPLLFLNSDMASYINGVDLPVDGGHWASMTVAGNLH
jgi:NAD(P)-dependent dehydrogenase (short-subunit alcohol dehydrogenase family)